MVSRPSLSADTPAISTRAEFLRLQQTRATPAPELNLNPEVGVGLTVDSQVEIEKEVRAKFIKAQLDQAGHKMRTDHTLSRLDGHARVDFDRSR